MTPQEIAKALIEEFHIADYRYELRESLMGEDNAEGFRGSWWDHPRMQRFSDVCDELSRLAKEGE